MARSAGAAYGPLLLDPAASVLHYGQEILRASRRTATRMVRSGPSAPEQNGERLQRSAYRLALPELPVDMFVESLRQVVQIDRRGCRRRPGRAFTFVHS